MIRHIVLLDWNSETERAAIEAAAQGFSALPDKIAEIHQLQHGADLGVYAGNADYVLMVDFECEADFKVYADHPEHIAFMKAYTYPIMASFKALQFRLP